MLIDFVPKEIRDIPCGEEVKHAFRNRHIRKLTVELAHDRVVRRVQRFGTPHVSRQHLWSFVSSDRLCEMDVFALHEPATGNSTRTEFKTM
jgi:hypothetical protein